MGREADPADLLVPLEYLNAGEWADVMEVHGEPSWIARMAELGIRSGHRVQVLQSGSPCIVQVGGARFSIRFDLTVQVLVRPIAGAAN